MEQKTKQKVCDRFCRNCFYYEKQHENCAYILLVGHSRGCDPGTGCIRKKEATGRRAYYHRRNTILRETERGTAYHPKKDRKPRITDEDERRQTELYNLGYSDRQIAEMMGKALSSINQWRNKKGWPSRRKMQLGGEFKCQNDLIANHLRQHGYITSLEAVNMYSIRKMSTRIHELEQKGMKIIREYGTAKNSRNATIRVTKYILHEDVNDAKPEDNPDT